DEIARVAATLQAGTRVFVSALARDTQDRAVAVAAQLRRAGLEPVPHIAARALPSFTAARAFLTRLAREAGVTQALLVGGDGARTLLKYALRCGVGPSIRALGTHAAAITRLFVESGPEPIVRALAVALKPEDGVAGLHFFPFGGFGRAAEWLNAVREGRFSLD